MEENIDLVSENKKLKRKVKVLEQSLGQFNNIKTSYDELIKKLEEKDKNLKAMNQRLEELVKERTKELEHMNEMLAENLEIVKELSIKDALTGLRNRRTFEEIFSREFSRARRENYNFNFLMIDVDNFKKYNDFYGHQKGDEVLKTIGETLNRVSQRGNDFVFRFGGEEFVYISCFLSYEKMQNLANLIKTSIESKNIEHEKNANHKVVTVSIGGVTVTKEFKYDKEKLFEIADNNLYLAKDKGRNFIVISEN